MNFLSGEVKRDGIDFGPDGKMTFPLPAGLEAGGRVTLGMRPEHMGIAEGNEGPRLAATVDLVERLGEVGFAHLRLPSGTVVVAEVRGDTGLGAGDLAEVSLDPSRLHLFGEDGRRLD